MALFGKKKNTEVKTEKKETAPKAAATTTASSTTGNTAVIKHARITEKASMQQANQIYVFDVAENATKRDISRAVTAIYKVVPRKVTVVNVRTKTIRSMRTGKTGMKGGGKKAYVYLKANDTITL